MNKRVRLTIFILACLVLSLATIASSLTAPPAQGAPVIEKTQSQVVVQSDGSLDIKYNLTFRETEKRSAIRKMGQFDSGHQMLDAQIESNGQVSPVDLLNRWIVPLENGVDYLRLRTGQTIVVPFLTLIVFSTNLDPFKLADDAFYRRRGDYPLCTAAAAVGDGELRVAVGAVTQFPTFLEVDPEAPGEWAAEQVEPWGGVHASPAYLKQLVRVLVDDAVARARERAA